MTNCIFSAFRKAVEDNDLENVKRLYSHCLHICDDENNNGFDQTVAFIKRVINDSKESESTKFVKYQLTKYSYLSELITAKFVSKTLDTDE